MNMKENDGPEAVLVCDACGPVSLTREQNSLTKQLCLVFSYSSNSSKQCRFFSASMSVTFSNFLFQPVGSFVTCARKPVSEQGEGICVCGPKGRDR
jgi:hypothetical protein